MLMTKGANIKVNLYAPSSYHVLGVTSLLDGVSWYVQSESYPPSLKVAYDDAYYLIIITGVSYEKILRCINWIQSNSPFLLHPAFIVSDGLPSLIQQQLQGCNVVLFQNIHSLNVLQHSLKTWLINHHYSYIKDEYDNYLTAMEWTILIRYLERKNMNKAASLSSCTLKMAYNYRHRAIVKLGFSHINDFLISCPTF